MFSLVGIPFVRQMFLFFRPKEKQDTYEVVDKEDSFYKKGKIGKSHDKKHKHLEHRLNNL